MLIILCGCFFRYRAGGDPLPPCPPPDGGTGWEPEPPSPPNPCDPYIKSLQTDVNFAAKFKGLCDSAHLTNVEKGYIVQNRTANNYIYRTGYPTASGGAINWGVLSGINGTIHLHYTGLGEMFTPQDIISMAQSFLLNETSDRANLFIGVATASGPYLIKVTDTAKFRKFANKIYNNGDATSTNEDKFRTKYRDKFRFSGNPILNEKGFLTMLDEMKVNSGFTLYSGNSDCNQWVALELRGHATGPDTVEKNDCN